MAADRGPRSYSGGMPVIIDCPEKQGQGLCPKCGLPLPHHKVPFEVIHDDPLCYQVVVMKSEKQHLLIHMSQEVYRDKFTETTTR